MTIIFDPLSSDFAQNPYKIYAKLRANEEPFFYGDQEMFLLSRYDDVSAIATNPAMVRSLVGFASEAELKEHQRKANWHDMPYHERVVQFSLLDSDGEVHRRLRKQVFGSFQTRSVEALEDIVRAYVRGLIDDFAERPSFDFIEAFAAKVPGYVIGHFLGVPAEDREQLRIWSENVVRFFDVDRTDEKKAIAEQSTKDFYHYLVDLKAERLKAPKDDLITRMIADEEDGRYNDDEFISTAMLILMAGHGSTIDVLGSGMHTLIERPDVIEVLKSDTSLLPTAIQEMFRYEPPLPFFHRHATEDVEVAGRKYVAGTTFGLLYASANRDPSGFENPDVFDIKRDPNRHLSFGKGAHLCLGNHLARMNMRVIFEELFARFSTFELATNEVTYKRGLSVHGPEALPVHFS